MRVSEFVDHLLEVAYQKFPELKANQQGNRISFDGSRWVSSRASIVDSLTSCIDVALENMEATTQEVRHLSVNDSWSADFMGAVAERQRQQYAARQEMLRQQAGYPPISELYRSEERRVGKECRARGSPYHEKQEIEKGSTID